MNNDRIIELEIKAVYQEDLLQALNQIVAGQQQQIDRLENTVKLLHERLLSLSAERSSSDNAIEKPPHY